LTTKGRPPFGNFRTSFGNQSAHEQLLEINENVPEVAQKWALFIGEYVTKNKKIHTKNQRFLKMGATLLLALSPKWEQNSLSRTQK
jgi:hypothetical protein